MANPPTQRPRTDEVFIPRPGVNVPLPKSDRAWQAALAALAALGRDLIAAPEAEVARRALNLGEAMAKEAKARGI